MRASSTVYLFVCSHFYLYKNIVVAFLMMRKRRIIKIVLFPVSCWVSVSCSLDLDGTGPTSPTARCPYDLQMPS